MKYGEGPPDGFSEGEWRSALQLQAVPDAALTHAQRELVNRPRRWNGEDPHAGVWSLRERQEWDAVIYSVVVSMPARRRSSSRKKALAA